MGYERIRDRRRIRRLVVDYVQTTGRKTSFPEDIANSPETLGGQFRAL